MESKKDEYDYDSSDEEDVLTTIGNVPIDFYKDLDHIGYDTSGRPVMKANTDSNNIDKFLEKCDNANRFTTVRHPITGQMIALSEKDIMFIKQLSNNRAYTPLNDPDLDPYYFTRVPMETPVRIEPPRKSSFVPCKYESEKVSKYVGQMKMGLMKKPEVHSEDEEENEDDKYYNELDNQPCIWDEKEKIENALRYIPVQNLQWLDQSYIDNTTKHQRLRQIIPPPPREIESHKDSYNPPAEYLLTEEERKREIARFFDRSLNPCRHRDEMPMIPKKMPNLRSVGYSQQLIIEEEKRTRDLICANRFVKKQVNSTTEKLLDACVPRVKLSDLEPYPNTVTRRENIDDIVLCLSISHDYIATIGYSSVIIYDKQFVKQREYEFSSPHIGQIEATRNHKVVWSPDGKILGVCYETKILLINPLFDDTDFISVESSNNEDYEPSNKVSKTLCQWNTFNNKNETRIRKSNGLELTADQSILDLAFHCRGNYFLSITGNCKTTTSGGKLMLHRMKQRDSVDLGNKSSDWHSAKFHPNTKSNMIYMAHSSHNESNVQIYDLVNKKLVQTLDVKGNLTCMDVHPYFDHLIVGNAQGKLFWFDLAMGVTPFKILHINTSAIRSLSFSTQFPLFACGSANGSVTIVHNRVSDRIDDKPQLNVVENFACLDKIGEMYSVRFDQPLCRLFCGGKGNTIFVIDGIKK